MPGANLAAMQRRIDRSKRRDEVLKTVHRMNQLSVTRGRLLARLRPVSAELANLRKQLETLLQEGTDANPGKENS